jgi:hypothetical protein
MVGGESVDKCAEADLTGRGSSHYKARSDTQDSADSPNQVDLL